MIGKWSEYSKAKEKLYLILRRYFHSQLFLIIQIYHSFELEIYRFSYSLYSSINLNRECISALSQQIIFSPYTLIMLHLFIIVGKRERKRVNLFFFSSSINLVFLLSSNFHFTFNCRQQWKQTNKETKRRRNERRVRALTIISIFSVSIEFKSQCERAREIIIISYAFPSFLIEHLFWWWIIGHNQDTWDQDIIPFAIWLLKNKSSKITYRYSFYWFFSEC